MVDVTDIGRVFPGHTAVIEAGRLRLFAKAIGETRAEYVDDVAARAAGYPALVAPPTFVGCLFFDKPDPYAWFGELGIDVARVLHVGERLRYFTPVHAGDRLTVASHIDDVVQKKGGAQTLVVHVTDVTNQHGGRVAEMRATIVVR